MEVPQLATPLAESDQAAGFTSPLAHAMLVKNTFIDMEDETLEADPRRSCSEPPSCRHRDWTSPSCIKITGDMSGSTSSGSPRESSGSDFASEERSPEQARESPVEPAWRSQKAHRSFDIEKADDVEDQPARTFPEWRSQNGRQRREAESYSTRSSGYDRSYGGSNQQNLSPGDWICDRCGDLQFARNHECRRCGAPPPASAGARSGRSSGTPTAAAAADSVRLGRSSRGGGVGRRGEKFAKSTPVAQSEGRWTTAKSSGKKAQQMLPGDWNCKKCGDLQFARNAMCRMCYTPKPGAEDGGRWRSGKNDDAH